MNYEAVYEERFLRNLRRYASLRERIRKIAEQRLMTNPYVNTEFPGDVTGKLNLRGCRSIRIDRNFRIIFVICEECRNIPECEYCFCDDLPDNTLVFLTVGPHDKAYAVNDHAHKGRGLQGNLQALLTRLSPSRTALFRS